MTCASSGPDAGHLRLNATDPNDDLSVEVHVVHGSAVKTLVAASQTADVLVVGSRGRGGFASLVLGSVADQVIRHSVGPVVVR